jgi:multidrug efflux pump subunit AcrA (membrane-fusion protein)
MVGLLSYAVYYVVASNKEVIEVRANGVTAADRGDMVSTFNSSATVQSGRQGVFEILDGTKVETVNVRVGDVIKKGDLLATFETAPLDALLAQKKKDYQSAQTAYTKYVSDQTAAPKRKAALDKQVTELEKRIAKLQAEESAKSTTAPQTVGSASKQLTELKESLSKLLGSSKMGNFLVEQVFALTGNVSQTLSMFSALLNSSLGVTDISQLTNLFGSFGALGNSELMGASIELIQLKLQQNMIGLSQTADLNSVYKAVADSAEGAYKQTENAVKRLKEGWRAAYDGIIREVNIKAGATYQTPSNAGATGSFDITSVIASLAAGQADVLSLLGDLFAPATSGMVVEYYPFTASFLLGKYDLAKVRMDQPVRVTSVSGKIFEGSVSFISPVASDGAALNISSLLGSSGSSKGVEAQIAIPSPDKSITIGLDVDVEIVLETKENVVRVPVESVQYDEETKGYYVFVYSEEDSRIQKNAVETGIMDGLYYEITKGLEEGTPLVRAPQKTMTDGMKIKLAKEK